MSDFDSFDDFWTFYVGEHRQPLTRALHFVGTTAVLGTLAVAVLKRRPTLLPWLPLVGYGPAWLGHFLVEKNKPATFRYPWLSLRADFVMWGRMLSGDMWS